MAVKKEEAPAADEAQQEKAAAEAPLQVCNMCMTCMGTGIKRGAVFFNTICARSPLPMLPPLHQVEEVQPEDDGFVPLEDPVTEDTAMKEEEGQAADAEHVAEAAQPLKAATNLPNGLHAKEVGPLEQQLCPNIPRSHHCYFWACDWTKD